MSGAPKADAGAGRRGCCGLVKVAVKGPLTKEAEGALAAGGALVTDVDVAALLSALPPEALVAALAGKQDRARVRAALERVGLVPNVTVHVAPAPAPTVTVHMPPAAPSIFRVQRDESPERRMTAVVQTPLPEPEDAP